ncbi:hypothetical protein A2U01_0016699, partial [Trifolium medium]|nr:hypothetical protein [Trifolium medium]
IIRHYMGRLINVEEPEKSLKGWVSSRLDDPPPPLKLPNLTALLFGQIIDTDRALVHIQGDSSSTTGNARPIS